jgi:hypothetical protein
MKLGSLQVKHSSLFGPEQVAQETSHSTQTPLFKTCDNLQEVHWSEAGPEQVAHEESQT